MADPQLTPDDRRGADAARADAAWMEGGGPRRTCESGEAVVGQPFGGREIGSKGETRVTRSPSRRSVTTAAAHAICRTGRRPRVPHGAEVASVLARRRIAERGSERLEGSAVVAPRRPGHGRPEGRRGQASRRPSQACPSAGRVSFEIADVIFHSYVLLAARASSRRSSRTQPARRIRRRRRHVRRASLGTGGDRRWRRHGW